MTHCANGHPEILHYEDVCPLCAAIESHERALAIEREHRTMNQGTIEDLENRIEQYRKELGL